MNAPRPVLDPKGLRPETRLVHAGIARTPFGENAEALFLTQSFVYDTAESCEARFSGAEPGYIYSRFSNPTVAMFEARMCAVEGAEAGRATATGMAAVTASLLCQLKAGDHVVAARALFGSCRYVIEELLPRFGVETTPDRRGLATNGLTVLIILALTPLVESFAPDRQDWVILGLLGVGIALLVCISQWLASRQIRQEDENRT